MSGEYWPSPNLQDQSVYRLIKKIGEGKYHLCIDDICHSCCFLAHLPLHHILPGWSVMGAAFATGAHAEIYLAEHLQREEKVRD